MDDSTISSLRGGSNGNKTLLIVSSVLFLVGIILLIVMLVKKSPSSAPAAAPPAAAQRQMRVSELGSEQEARAALAGPSPTMVFLYADWCGFCKKANPIYDALAADPAYKHVKLMKLNADKAKALAKEKGVSGFPTFLTNWGEGKHVGYKDLPKMQAILKSAKGGARMGHARGHTEAEVVAALQGKEPVVVFLSADSCGFCKKMSPVWEEAVPKFKHIKMMRIDGKNARELVKANGVTGFPTFLSNRGEGKYVGYRPKDKFEEMLVKLGKS
jgi:thioredoxin 1